MTDLTYWGGVGFRVPSISILNDFSPTRMFVSMLIHVDRHGTTRPGIGTSSPSALNPLRWVGVFLAFFLLAACFLVEPIQAQERDRMGMMNREKMEKRIDMMRKWRLMEEMNVGDEVYDRLFPVLAKYKNERKSLQKEKMGVIQELRKAIQQEQPVEPLLQKFVQLKANKAELSKNKMSELHKILTPQQLAKFIVVSHEFERDIRHMISKRDHRMKQMMMEHRKKMMGNESDPGEGSGNDKEEGSGSERFE